MKISKQNHTHEWYLNIDVPINDLIKYKDNIYKCVKSNGGCGSEDGKSSCCFGAKDGVLSPRCGMFACTINKRKDKTYVMFQKIK